MPDVPSSSTLTHGREMRKPSLIDYIPVPPEQCDSAASRGGKQLARLFGLATSNHDLSVVRKGDSVVTPAGHYCTVLGVSMLGRATILAEDGTVLAMDIDRLQKVQPKYAS